MIVQCAKCPAKYNNDTVSTCPLCEYAPRTRVTDAEKVESQVKQQFRSSGRRSRE